MDMARQRAKDPGSGTRQRLTARDWADAALAAIGEGGLAAVAVEPLAARLGATKGSFYWHFTNRDALIEAALERWVELGTEAVITEVAAEPAPAERLRRLLRNGTARSIEDPLEMSLLATAAQPRVAAALARVTERRIGYIASLFTELGFTEDEARHRALLAYSAYLGHAQLGHAVPQSLPAGAARDRYLERVVQALLRPA
ncbi:putative TetR family transcriptional regulator [Streptomyces sp. NBRC 110611]|uniref:TetR/AcrR family transcriptional regulator n=1 Tax=Streptomyces sp. NBRC 110611 TaxID=1621259 RepID=UPI000830E61E|nr:TetR/AcrR family transcriptional regulator [Streptomyces sp. NBRC 110611]GAU67251.1 putative TetR family transcriptional regulator [Streptomyces sp. NBRC 110611]